MATTEYENTTTGTYTILPTLSDQGSPTTRRLVVDHLISELETREIEANADFHATVLRRIRTAGRTIDAGDIVGS
jgi:hypothetical protein